MKFVNINVATKAETKVKEQKGEKREMHDKRRVNVSEVC